MFMAEVTELKGSDTRYNQKVSVLRLSPADSFIFDRFSTGKCSQPALLTTSDLGRARVFSMRHKLHGHEFLNSIVTEDKTWVAL